MRRLFCLLLIALTSTRTSTANAEGLAQYLNRLGPPTEIAVTEKDEHGPTRVAFQSHVWRGLPWKHEIILKHPKALQRKDFVAILLTGGTGGDQQQTSAQQLADALGIRTAVFTKVPNQPLLDGKTEDVLLSYTLDQYRQTGDSSWPLLFPMVSSVVKGIDTLEQVLQHKDLKVVLIGASKRGWTTYLTAAVDKRIAAMVPTVFEMVSMQKQVALARERYGRDSEKIRPYTALGLTDSLTEPRVAELISWIDPIEYFPRYTMPKLVLLGANDPYWVVDSVREYWNRLPEPKMLRILPNVGHGVLAEQAAGDAIVSFIGTVMSGGQLPQVRWNFSAPANGKVLIVGQGSVPLTRCSVWQATSESTDFRNARFSPTPCDITNGGKEFKALLPTPPNNVAVFAEVETAPNNDSAPLTLSTESQVYLVHR